MGPWSLVATLRACAISLAVSAPAPAERTSTGAFASPELIVMPLAVGGLEPEVVRAADAILAHAIARRAPHSVASVVELEALWGLERLKDVIGCEDVVCMAELAAAFSARQMVAGSVSRLGDRVFVSLQLFDLRRRVLVRRILVEEDAYALDLARAVRRGAEALMGRGGEAPREARREQALRVQELLEGDFVCPDRPSCARRLRRRLAEIEDLLSRQADVRLTASQRGLLEAARRRTERALIAVEVSSAAPPR